MKKFLGRLIAAVLCYAVVAAGIYVGSVYRAFADYTATLGSGSTVFAFLCFTTKICPAHVNVNSAGTEIMTTSNPGQIDWSTSSQAHTDMTSPVPCKAFTTSSTQTPVSSGTATAAGCDLNGNLYVNAALSLVTIPHAQTTALANNLSAKASAGVMTAFNCTSITGGAAGFCIAYNGSTTPSTGALTGANVLDFCYFDTTARGCSLSHLFPGAIAFSSGIQILVSSAASPYTYTTGTDTAAISADYQ